MIISGKVVVLSFIIVGMLALIAAFLICFIEDKEDKKVNKDKNDKKENIKQVDMKGALKYFKIINK